MKPYGYADARCQQIRGAYRSKRHPVDPIIECAYLPASRLQSKPGLARTARPQERNQRVVRAIQVLDYRCQLFAAPYEGRQLPRKVVTGCGQLLGDLILGELPGS